MSEFRIGSVIGRSFSVIFQNFVPFAVLSLIVYLPLIALAFVQIDPNNSTMALPIAALAFLLQLLMVAALTYGSVQSLRGTPAGIGDCLRYGLARILPILGVAIVMWFALLIGLLLLVLPFFFILTLFYFAVPVSVVERPGVIPSLSRSAGLTRGYRWRVFGLVLLMILISMVIAFLFGFGAGFLGAVSGSPVAGGVLQAMTNAIVSLFPAVVAAVGYHDLRVAKEGIDTEQLAAVFA